MVIGSHKGHRNRLIKKAEESKLSPNEYLEAFLFPLIPRIDTSPIAHRLISRFGTLKGVFTASVAELEEVEGVGHATAVHIHLIGGMFVMISEEERKAKKRRFESESVMSYIKRIYKDDKIEALDILLFNEDADLVNRLRYTIGSKGEVQMDLAEISSLIQDENPSGLLIVHNHPSGLAKPSDADNFATSLCGGLCNVYNVLFCEHVVHASPGEFSYYKSGGLGEEGFFPIESMEGFWN
jgi:DNA repair protein RadC